ncbi:TIGR01212 family radical SAM protein [Streptococcaceae bacterium ESL0729]|nr:TIGR01212 family radical SAM protein [Streptococcaceae bacterium ESL0729]
MNQKSYTTWNEYLRNNFGEKIFKVPIDAGFDCPNRDGTVAVGGCTFCTVSGSGDMIIAPDEPIPVQFQKEVDFLHKKWGGVEKYIVYFQNFTNTHAPVEILRERFEQAVNMPNVVGINIGTRPDCLPPETIDYLGELNERMTVWVELGLQTTYQATSDLINRAHDYQTYLDAVSALRAKNILVCTHLINGLPGETADMMLENVRRTVQDSDIQGIKLHLLHLMKNTRMQRDFHEGRLQLLSQKEYVNIICDQLEIIPKEIVIHRLTGDAPRDSLIGPMWSLKKWEVLNAIDAEMARRGSTQGCKLEEELKGGQVC